MKHISGFTLIEVLVVTSILTLLAGFLVIYTRGSETQIKLLREKATFLNNVYRARSMAIRTIQSTPPECGYGIYILDERRYTLWRDTATKPDCSTSDSIYNSPAEDFEKPFELQSGLRFLDVNVGDALRSILFIPPDPRVVTVPEIAPGGAAVIRLGTVDRASIAEIKINRYGQIEPGIGY